MDQNRKWVLKKQIERTMIALNKNFMEAYYVESTEELKEKILELTSSGGTVSVGGSMSLFEAGVIDMLRNSSLEFLDRYEDGLSKEEMNQVFRNSFFADHYITSTNALTEAGELYNIDGNGNRVAAMIYGPKSVIVVAGYNKIVKDMNAAEERLRRIAAPSNAARLGIKTPCATTGVCSDCKSPGGICSSFVKLGRQIRENRIKVIIVGESLGY